MTKIRLKFINSYRDRHGKLRYYFRRAGFKKMSLPGMPGSADFMAAYQSALASSSTPIEIGARKNKPGTVAAAVAGYLASRAYLDLAPATKQTRRSILENFRTQFGDGPIASLRRVNIEQIIERQPTPATAQLLFVAIRELMKFSVRMGLRADDPTQGVQRPRLKGDGLHTWSDADIAKFEATHPIGSRARLAMGLGLYLGQRRSDVIKMGWQHIRNDPQGTGRYLIRVKQQKTGAPLDIPVHVRLQAMLDALPRTQLAFLTTQYNKPFGVTPFGNWFKAECRKAGLPEEAAFHGLRKAAARRLAEAGCSVKVIAAVTGHRSLNEIARYTASADQLRLARMGIGTIA
jgi:integrase